LLDEKRAGPQACGSLTGSNQPELLTRLSYARRVAVMRESLHIVRRAAGIGALAIALQGGATSAGARITAGHAPKIAAATTLQQVLDTARQRSGAPGAQAAILVSEGAPWTDTSGVSALATSEPVTPGTLFSLASVTKTYTAALTLRLVEAGDLSLDDTVGHWLGRLVGHGVAASTVRQLLSMTSGLPDYTEVPQLARAFEEPNHRWRLRELLRAIGPPHDAGRYEYSNSNYILLGAIDARAGSEPVGTLLDSLILTPLQLSSTYLDRTPGLTGFAAGYELLPDGRILDTFAGARSVPTSVWGPLFTDGGIEATATSVAQFAAALYMGRLLAPGMLATMLAPGPDGSYGMGTYRYGFDGHLFQGHDGAFDGFSSDAFTDISRGVTIVVLANGMNRRGELDPADLIWKAVARAYDEGDR
jgi:D-alanyl-D-alanine carboxypeptidase